MKIKELSLSVKSLLWQLKPFTKRVKESPLNQGYWKIYFLCFELTAWKPYSPSDLESR
jgi:hypothetical protein